MIPSTTVEAPAKINLTLEVTGVLDNGYHTLDTLFAWLELHDTLELSQASTTRLEIESDGADLALVVADESNLVMRALRALEAWAGRELPTHFVLRKRIPAGGGLGGGSADAAAALVGLRRLHGLDLSDEDLHGIAARLGADVAFGVKGGFARGQGFGDQLTPLQLPPDLHDRTLILLAPGFPCPTPQVYGAWDRSPESPAQGATERFLEATPQTRLEAIANDLEPAAIGLFPQLVALKRRMVEAGLEGVALSGSGSTLFGFLPREGPLDSVQKTLSGFGRVIPTRLRKDERE